MANGFVVHRIATALIEHRFDECTRGTPRRESPDSNSSLETGALRHSANQRVLPVFEKGELSPEERPRVLTHPLEKQKLDQQLRTEITNMSRRPC